MDILEIK